MITKNKIKEIKSLSQKKFRQKYNKYTAEGCKIIEQFLNYRSEAIDIIYHTSSCSETIIHTAINKGISTEEIDEKEMKSISQLTTPSEILVVCHMNENALTKNHLRQQYSIYLDDVQDPGNVGTIMRIADWFGIKNIIRSSGTVDFYNSKVIQATMGSIVNLHLFDCERISLIEYGLPLYGTYMQGSPLQDIKWSDEGIIIMGNEGKGIHKEIYNHIQHKITINGSQSRSAESLNVAMAAGIVCQSMFTALK